MHGGVVPQVAVARQVGKLQFPTIKTLEFYAAINLFLYIFRIAHGNIFPVLGFHAARMAQLAEQHLANRLLATRQHRLNANAVHRIIRRRSDAAQVENGRRKVNVAYDTVIFGTRLDLAFPLKQHRHAHAIVVQRCFAVAIGTVVGNKDNQRILFKPQLLHLVDDRTNTIIKP